MLAPNDIEPIINSLKTFYTQIRAADQLNAIGESLTLYPVKKEAPWIITLRQRTAMMRRDVVGWQDSKISIIPQTLSPFIQYHNKFHSVANFLPSAESGDMAARLLDRLVNETESNLQMTRQARMKFEDWTKKALLNVEPLNESIQQAWRDLGMSERKIVTLSNEIVHIQDEIECLKGVVALDSLSSNTVSDMAGIMAGGASMIYDVVVSGYAIPYLGVVKMFFTTGKLFYDIFSTADKIHKQIEKLSKYSLDLTFEQQALAQTKASLAFVYDLKSLIERQQTILTEVEEFWQQEKRNLVTVRDFFALSKDFAPDNPEILQLPIADSVWFSLKDASQVLAGSLNKAIDYKTKININT
jgi:hypothetical protein